MFEMESTAHTTDKHKILKHFIELRESLKNLYICKNCTVIFDPSHTTCTIQSCIKIKTIHIQQYDKENTI